MIAYCGLECDSCPVHLATIEPDLSLKEKMRSGIAMQLAKLYGATYQPGDISDCDGCAEANGRLFRGCAACEIRQCAIQKNLRNCAYCDNYVCEKLKRHFEEDPSSEKRLNDICHDRG